jgi:4-hydroxy-3-methylbut-2-en-1-yl diphosphate reductase
MNVQMIEKLGEGKKNFSTIQEGDVVILPAFGASFEEMEYLDKQVCGYQSRARATFMHF